MDRLQIIVGDIFEMNADALIFPANPLPEVGGSLDRIVYEKTGWDSLLEARKEIGVLKSTESKITKALKLHTKEKRYKYLIHSVTPKYDKEKDYASLIALDQTYYHALEAAEQEKDKSKNYAIYSIVSALLGVGANGFSVDKAKEIAEIAIQRYFADHPESHINSVTIVLYDVEKEKTAHQLRECLEHIKQAAWLLEEDAIRNEFRALRATDTTIMQYIDKLGQELMHPEISEPIQLYMDFCQQRDRICRASRWNYENYNDQAYNRFKKDVLTPRSKMIKSTLGLTSSFEKLSLTVRNNVLRLGMAACLNKDQFYFLAFCKGFIFPNCDLDWKILAFLETVNDIDDEEKVKNLYYEKYMDYIGTIQVGIDLSEIQFDVNEASQTIYVTLPAPEIISHSIDTSSFVFTTEKDGLFTDILPEDFVSEANSLKAQQEDNKTVKPCVPIAGINNMAIDERIQQRPDLSIPQASKQV